MSENIATETHPITPWLPENARLLMCGTFPPTRDKWSMDFYYPNFINDMWRIFGIVFFGDKDRLVDIEARTFRLDDIKRLLLEKGVALSDTGRRVHREKGNASDKFLRILEPIDLRATLRQMPQCTMVATTGEKAAGIIAEITSTPIPKMGTFEECDFTVDEGDTRRLQLWRMPSSSRAYPMKLEKKAEIYDRMLSQLNCYHS